jgi:heme oxygenase
MEAALATPAISSPVPLHQLLRAHSASAHARLDAGIGGLRTARDYGAYLRGMAAFLDAARAVLGDEPWLADARRQLADDLGRDVPSATPRAGAGDLPRIAGWRYVVAGSSLGARVLLRDARRLAGETSHGTRFLSAFATGDAWPRCLAWLRDTGFDASARARACDAALEAFHSAEAALSRAKSQS